MPARRAFAVLCFVPACTCGGAPSHDAVVPAELADEEALQAMSDWRALPVFGQGRYRQQSSEDRRTGDKPEIALWDHDNRDMNNFLCAGSESDAPAGRVRFVFDMEACPEPYVKGLVMARFEGSGRLARLWLTAASIRAAPPDRELVRFYVDDDVSPRVELPLASMLQGSTSAIWAPPFGAGSRRRLAWYYPLVFSRKLIVALDRVSGDDLYFHQTAVVLDEVARERRAAATPLALRDGVRRLLGSTVPDAGTAHARAVTLAAGEEQLVHALRGPATIVNARVRLDRDALDRLASVALSVHWDGDDEAAIAVPLSDLFAAGDAVPEPASLALGSAIDGDTLELSLRLPMPFASQSRWLLKSSAPMDLELVLETIAEVPKASWGHLHVERHETSAPQAAHPLVLASGRGRLAGVCMQMQGHGLPDRGHPMHFLEGDELGVIDGERAIAGTGTEDYFNGSFYFEDGSTATAFAQVWGVRQDARSGRASACRWHVLGDAIDFQSSLGLEMEVGPGVPSVLERYRSVAFVYR